MDEFFKNIILCQIIFVISLLSISIQVYQVLKFKEFKFISLAWSINLAYLISYFFLEKYPHYSLLDNILGIGFDCISIFYFLKAALFFVKEGDRYYWVKKISEFKIIFTLLFFGTINILYPIYIHDSLPFLAIGSIPSAIIDGFVLYLLSLYFKKLCEIHKLSNKLYYGVLVYACIQIISIAKPDTFLFSIPFYKIGLSIGLILKVWIVYFLIGLVFSIAKSITDKQYIASKLDQIILNTFHEISHPLSNINRYINLILPDETNEIPNKNEIIKNVKLIESSYHHLAAIIAASLKENEDHLTGNFKKEFDNVIPKDKVIQAISVNTLIEIAVFHTKAISNDKIEFFYDFGGNCNIFCNPTLIIEIFENLFINSKEAFPGNAGTIRIRTRLEKVDEQRIDLDYDRIVNISVEDNGSGIDKNILSLIYEEGFSTKNKAIKGRGLYLIKQILNRMGGKIICISPVNENALDNRFGTRFNISIPVIDDFLYE